MGRSFTDRVCNLIAAPRRLSGAERAEAVIAFEDTMAVAYAGWHEPVVQATLSLYRGRGVALIDGTEAGSVEHAALIHATAGHALDYDDVQLTTVSHPSVPVVPALLAVAASRPGLADRMIPAFAIGVAVNIAVGRVMGFAHYDKGWHATSTLGPLAVAAALSHLIGLDRTASRHALAIAAAQAGGMQRNFGTMAKPLQAGLAAAAGVRAVLLAEAGLTADDDIFGPRGFFDLYRGEGWGDPAESVPVEIDMFSLARKLYPCCYMNHRLIAAALSARAQLPGGAVPEGAKVVVTAPHGTLVPLRVDDPRTGLEAKFCGPYSIAAALAQGSVMLGDFEDEAVSRPPIRALMRQIDLSEQPLDGPVPIGLDFGVVRLSVEIAGRTIACAEIEHYPGSPKRPATDSEMEAKIADCLGIFRRRANRGPAVDEFRAGLRLQLGLEPVAA